MLAFVYGAKGLVTAAFAAIVITDRAEVPHIFVFILTMGMLQATSFPARQSLVPRIVPANHIYNAFAMSMLTSSSSRLLVPAATGIMIILLGPGQTLMFGAAMYLVAALSVSTIRLAKGGDTKRDRGSAIKEFIDGVRYVRREPLLFPIVLLGAAAYTILTPSVGGLLPVYASEIFDVGPGGLGLMMSALGVGATLGTLALASLPVLRYKGRIMVGCLALMAVAGAAFSGITTLVAALPLLVLVNGGFDTFAAVRSGAIQAIAPDEMRGRATAVNGMGSGFSPVGGLLIGAVAELSTPQWATLTGASLMVLSLAVITLKFPRVWDFDR